MPRASVAAGVLAALAAASPALAQGNGNGHGHRPSTPPSRNSLAPPAIATSNAGVTPFAWLEDASVLEPGAVSLAVSVMRWQGADTSEVDVPVVDVAMGLTERVHLTASVPRVVDSADTGGPVGGVGTSFFSAKVALVDDRRRGVKLSASATLEVLGEGVLQSLDAGANRVQIGFPVSAEIDRGALRLFAGGGYFSRGIWFGGGGIGLRASARAVVSGSFSRSWRRADAIDVPLSDRDRNEVSGGVSYALSPQVSVFGSVGHTIATLDQNGAGATAGAGIAFFLAPPRK
jgi:hypothetical protein